MARRTPRKMTNKTVQVAQDIRISADQHQKLLEHIKDRLQFANELRGPLVDHYEVQDRYLAGYILRSEDDKKRESDNEKGYKIKPIDHNVQLAAAQLDEATTYICSILFPESGMYGAITNRGEQALAQGMARRMNNDAQQFDHYSNSERAVFDMLSKNFGGVITEWSEIRGPRPISTGMGNLAFKEDVLYAGNDLPFIDPYNFLWDVSVRNIWELPLRGEFFAVPDSFTKFRIQKMRDEGELYNVDDLLKNESAPEAWYYRPRPHMHNRKSTSDKVDWYNLLTAGAHRAVGSAYELVTFYAWIYPNEFGLDPNQKEMQIWRIVMANGSKICHAMHLNNAHGQLPCALARLLDTGLANQEPSFGDKLLPFQHFASFLMNLHQDANRKSLFGTTWYDEQFAPLTATADPVSAKIPVKGLGNTNKTIRDVVHQTNDAPRTENTLRDIEATNDMMQKILPTDALRQVANLERATQYQAAATMQAVHARLRKLARKADSQCFSKARKQQYYNNIQYLQTIDIIDDETGEERPANTTEYVDFNVDALASDSIHGVDKLIMAEMLRDIINMAIQSQVAIQEMDILALIDYFTDIMGDKTDFMQFKRQSLISQLTPEQQDVAYQLFVAAQQETQGAQQQASPLAAE